MSLLLPSESRRVARDTAQYDALKKATDAFDEPFMDISRAVHHPWKGPVKVAPDNWNSLLSDFKRTGSALLNMLDISFENPKWEKRLKKYIRRLNNLKKMLKTLLAPNDFDSFQEVFYGLTTKSKDPWQKYIPYRDEVLAIIRNFDAEVEGTI